MSRRHRNLNPDVDLDPLGGGTAGGPAGGSGGRLMTWSASLNIYRVNRFHPIDLRGEDQRRGAGGRRKDGGDGRFDLVENLLARNLVHVVEDVFLYVGMESAQDCLLVCRLWHDFLSAHLFKRWAERMVDDDESLRELASAEGWLKYLHLSGDQVDDFLVYRRICCRIYDLREVWRFREPKLRRLQCDSFVLSLKFVGDSLYCGLNNGCLQLWDLERCSRRREQEVHDKGVKCVDVDGAVVVTGSYDCTAKVWSVDGWDLLHVIAVHSDSVWDLRLRDGVLVTASLDGTVGMFALSAASLETRFVLQAHQDLVSAVDLNDDLLAAGYEDSVVGVWDLLQQGRQQQQPVPLHLLRGHTGGITGLRMNAADVLASASYDGTVRLWNARTAQSLHVFREPEHFVRCVSLSGNALAAGDFGGHVHVWDVHVPSSEYGPPGGRPAVVSNHRCFKSHSGHVVSLQISARRVVSGSRDKTALVQDFWAKMLDGERRRREATAEAQTGKKRSRFLKSSSRGAYY